MVAQQITNKLIMQWKINNMVICLRNGENLTTKTPPGDFQVTTPETLLLSQQVIISKGTSSTLPTYIELLPQYLIGLVL